MLPRFHPSATQHGTPEKPSGMAHFGRYDGTPADVAYGDSLEASARAAREGWEFIDKNLLCTIDLVPIVNHSTVLNTKLGGMFSYRWTGQEWGEGEKVLDPKRALSVGSREWSDVERVTDITGKRRIWPLEVHVADGVKRNLKTMPEAKSQKDMTKPAFWDNVADAMDRHGHPRWMMTLSQYGSPLGRCKVATTRDFETIILPRGERPANFEKDWRPYVDRLWGPAWGVL